MEQKVVQSQEKITVDIDRLNELIEKYPGFNVREYVKDKLEYFNKKPFDNSKIAVYIDGIKENLFFYNYNWSEKKNVSESATVTTEKDLEEKEKARSEAAKVFTRIGQAEAFIKNQPLFYDRSGLWWLWNLENKYWQLVDEVDILNLVEDNLAIDTVNSKVRIEIINALKQVGRKNIPKFSDKKLIQFKNGLVHLNYPNDLIEPTPNYFITNPIPWEIGDSEETPIIDQLFKQWVGEDYKKTLYEIIAFCMLPDYPLHRIFCFTGSGLNGKGTYLRLINKFLGENNVASSELDCLISSRFEVTKLHKKLACQMGETNFSEINKTSMLKKLSGGDLIGFEYKGKTPFDDYNYAKILISTNSLPTTSDKTIGFYRRWMIIDFPNEFNEKKDVLCNISDEEFKNLARKSINTLKSLLENREFWKEGTIEERKQRYEERSNPFDKFWEGFIEESLEEDAFITKSDFKRKLNSWLMENRHRGMSDMSIAAKMEAKNVIEQRVTLKEPIQIDGQEISRVRVWSGIRWLIGHPVHPVHPITTSPLHKKGSIDTMDTLDTLDTGSKNNFGGTL